MPVEEVSRLTATLAGAFLRALRAERPEQADGSAESLPDFSKGQTTMKAPPLVKNYYLLTPEERFRLILAASGRGDEAELSRGTKRTRRLTIIRMSARNVGESHRK